MRLGPVPGRSGYGLTGSAEARPLASPLRRELFGNHEGVIAKQERTSHSCRLRFVLPEVVEFNTVRPQNRLQEANRRNGQRTNAATPRREVRQSGSAAVAGRWRSPVLRSKRRRQHGKRRLAGRKNTSCRPQIANSTRRGHLQKSQGLRQCDPESATPTLHDTSAATGCSRREPSG